MEEGRERGKERETERGREREGGGRIEEMVQVLWRKEGSRLRW